jgi:hypothetical protein
MVGSLKCENFCSGLSGQKSIHISKNKKKKTRAKRTGVMPQAIEYLLSKNKNPKFRHQSGLQKKRQKKKRGGGTVALLQGVLSANNFYLSSSTSVSNTENHHNEVMPFFGKPHVVTDQVEM